MYIYIHIYEWKDFRNVVKNYFMSQDERAEWKKNVKEPPKNKIYQLGA